VTSIRPVLAAALLALFAAPVGAQARPNLDLSRARVAAEVRPADGVFVVAHDPGRGVPALMWTPLAAAPPRGLSAEAGARLQLERYAAVYGATPAAVAGARLQFVHDMGPGGTIVALRQTVAGVEVFHGDIKLLLDRERRLLAVSGSPHPAARPELARRFAMAPATAISAALADLHGAAAGASRLVAEASATASASGWQRFALAAGGELRFLAPARAKPVYFPREGALVPAHFVELQTALGGAEAVVQYVIGDDGALLYRRDATASDVYKYRVWAEPGADKRPLDGPTVDFTPHPTGEPGKGPDGFVEPLLVAMVGFNTNPDGQPDPWLPPGALETVGNNVDAYIDHTAPSGLGVEDGEYRAKVSGPGVFDWTYDVEAEPLADQAQSMASITSLFYINNWMHDWWYDSGFTEATGNAQQDNFGRGGEEGDPLLAEAQDGALEGSRNNANMATPADGASPRMQMFLWTGLHTWAELELLPQKTAFPASTAVFGPANFELAAAMVLVQDGAGVNPTDGCEPPLNDLGGKIALVDRGNCTFEVKVATAQAAGAVGVVIADNVVADQPITPGGDPNTKNPTLPAQGTTQAAGVALKAALQQGVQVARMFATATVERDGTLDNMIVAHEWGHFLHHRLVECGSRACAAESEGWGDFVALHMALREYDDLDGSFAMDTYASLDPSAYFGIRRVPYSVDPAHNALSFRHISDGQALPDSHPMRVSGPNSQVHNAGEVWASMMWESYVALHKAHQHDLDFDARRRLMSDYVVAGMMLAPPSPTFTEQRDALLMAIAARSHDDFITVASAFARRGAGSCAVGPDRNSSDLVGVQEDFDLQANALVLAARVEDDASCDEDGVVDVGELGRLVVTVYNGGALPLPAGTTVEVVDPDASLMLPQGATLVAPALAPLERVDLELELGVDAALAAHRSVALTLRLAAAAGCAAAPDRVLPIVVHADLAPASAASDDVEAEPSVWTRDGGAAAAIWTRRAAPEGHFWHADDVSYTSDTRLVSPPLEVSRTTPFEIRFAHRHSFEVADGVNWDGAVIELSSDEGETWVDISTLAGQTGYGGVIISEANPLHGRSGFVGTNPSYPARDTETLLLGHKLAGQTVRLRFRVGTDARAGAEGWDIDDIAFTGLDNTPFPRWTAHAGACGAGDTDGESSGTGGEPGDSSGAPPTTGGAPGTGDASGGPETDDTASSTGEDSGCGCVGAGGGPLAPAGVGALLLLLGRRRRRR